MQLKFYYAKKWPIEKNEEEIPKEKLEKLIGFHYSDTVRSSYFSQMNYNSSTIDMPSRENKVQSYIRPENINELLVIGFINKEVGHGVFARKDIQKGTYICIYAGELLNPQQHGDNYTFSTTWPREKLPDPTIMSEEFKKKIPSITSSNDALNLLKEELNNSFALFREHIKPHICFISAGKEGNFSRFFQHLPDTSFHPIIATQNIKILHTFDEKLQLPVTLFVSRRHIKKGEQIGFDYGQEYWKACGERPKYFTMSGQVLDEAKLNELKRREEKVQKIKDQPISKEEEKIAKVANRYQFFEYPTLCNLTCVNKAFHEELDPLITYVRNG